MVKKRLKNQLGKVIAKQIPKQATWSSTESLKLFFWLGILVVILSWIFLYDKKSLYGIALGVFLSLIGLTGLLFGSKKRKSQTDIVVKRISVPAKKEAPKIADKTKKSQRFSFFKKLFKKKEKIKGSEKKAEAKKKAETIVNSIKSAVDAKKQFETDLDVLMNIVNKHNALSLSEVSVGFGIEKEKAEEWGKILAEHELLEIRYPTFGEPIFVKIGAKEVRTTEEVKPKKEIKFTKTAMLVSGAVMLLLLLFISVRTFYNPEEAGIAKDKFKIEKIGFDVVEAFSGQGSFRCGLIADGKNITYFIKDKNMKMVIRNGFNSTSVFKDDKLYSYVSSKDIWVKSNAPENIAVPGSGKVPAVNMQCKKEAVGEEGFTIPIEKVV